MAIVIFLGGRSRRSNKKLQELLKDLINYFDQEDSTNEVISSETYAYFEDEQITYTKHARFENDILMLDKYDV